MDYFDNDDTLNTMSACLKEAEAMLAWGQNSILQGLFADNLRNNLSAMELCSNSTLHRGYFHPSPIYDLVVGNTKRGSLKPLNSHSPITHRYWVDNNGRLSLIESITPTRISHTEKLFFEDNEIVGITVDCNGHLSAVSKERYDGARIAYFALMNCAFGGEAYKCFNFHSEQYTHDSLGLSECDFINVSPLSHTIVRKRYAFERQNGFLISYRDLSSPKQVKYTITKKRKA